MNQLYPPDKILTWHPASRLPTPSNHPLWLELDGGQIILGYRREYIASRNEPDLGYTDKDGAKVLPVRWAYA